MKKSKYLPILSSSVASGMSVRDAAGIAGCTESTAYSISCTDDFGSEVNRLRTAAVEQAVSILTSNATAACNSLVKLLNSQDEKIVLAASAKLLGSVGPFTEQHELRTRVNVIESQGTTLRVAQ